MESSILANGTETANRLCWRGLLCGVQGTQVPLESFRLNGEAADSVAGVLKIERRYLVQYLGGLLVDLHPFTARVIGEVTENRLEYTQPLLQVIAPHVQRGLRLRWGSLHEMPTIDEPSKHISSQ